MQRWYQRNARLMAASRKPNKVVTRQTKWSQPNEVVTNRLACVLFIGQTAERVSDLAVKPASAAGAGCRRLCWRAW